MSIINTSQIAGSVDRIALERLTSNQIKLLSKRVQFPEPDGHICLEVINQCNLQCKYCLSYCGIRHLDTDAMKRLICILKQNGVKSINISGGEPTLRKDLSGILKYIKSLNIEIALTTNGTILDEKSIRSISQYLDYICISLHSVKPANHDDLVGINGACKKVMKTIQLCHKYNIPIRLNTVVSKKNIDELLDMVGFIEGNDFLAWKLMLFTPRARGQLNKKEFLISKGEYNTIVKKIKQKCLRTIIITSKPKQGNYANCIVNSDGGLLVLDRIIYNAGSVVNIGMQGIKQKLYKYNIDLKLKND